MVNVGEKLGVVEDSWSAFKMHIFLVSFDNRNCYEYIPDLKFFHVAAWAAPARHSVDIHHT
jgi:hypothetical protein